MTEGATATGEPDGGRLWMERAAREVGVPDLSDRSRWLRPETLVVVSVVAVDVFGLQVVKQLAGGTHILLENPAWALLPVSGLLALFGARYLRDQYAEAVRETRIRERADEPARFDRLTPGWVTPTVSAVVGVGFVAYLLVSGRAATILAHEGIPGAIGWFVFIPGVYGPVLVELAVVYLSVHLLVPHRVATAGVSLQFLDPHGLGGLRPFGELLKRAYYVYTAALLLLVGLVYAPFALESLIETPYARPGLPVGLLFTLAWGVGVVSIGVSIYRFHRFMHREKRREARRLADGLPDRLDDLDVWAREPGADPETDRIRLESVRNTREVPTTFSMWSQIAVSVVLPKALQLFLEGFV